MHNPILSARINKLLQTIDPVSRTSGNQHESAINKTLIMQTRINHLRETLETLQKSYNEALNQSQIAEILLNTKLSISEALIRDQLENNMKQRFVQNLFFLSSVTYPAIPRCDISSGKRPSKGNFFCPLVVSEVDALSPARDAISTAGDLLASPNFGKCDTCPFSITTKTKDFICTYRLASLDLRRQKLVEQSLNLVRRVEEVKVATKEWKSNLTSLSIGESGLTVDSSNGLRERVTKISQEVKKLEDDMKTFVNQVYKLQDMSKNFDRELKSLHLSVQDASQVCHINFFILFFYDFIYQETQNLFSEVGQVELQAQRAVEKSTMIESEVQKIRENLRGKYSLSSYNQKLFFSFY